MKIEYSSNNSGGDWWLSDKDWKKLEKAGWCVAWGGTYFCHTDGTLFGRPAGAPEPCAEGDECPGHRKYESYTAAKEAGSDWLGCYARSATKDFPSLAAAVKEWEGITGQDAEDEGCNCCGQPHRFSEDT